MNIFKKLWKKSPTYRNIDEIVEEELFVAEEAYVVSRKQLDMRNGEDRERYLTSLLEQISDAQTQVDSLKKEYQTVNCYLQDMEDLEYIQGEEKQLLKAWAKSICSLEKDKSHYEEKKQRLTESDFAKMERLEDDTDEGVKKLKEAEEYKQAIQSDLKRLENEKHAYQFRKQEAAVLMENLRGMVIICTVALFACMGMLLFMQFVLEMDTKIGYILTALVSVVALTVMFMKYQEAAVEYKRATSSLNKVILLQNKVKIRYVNNASLLDYLYMKFGIASAKELDTMWSRYQEEKEERLKMREAMKELDETQEQMVRLLKEKKLHDPMIWIHQAEAILDPKEMVEIRHSLIGRRQKLRKQMEFNTQNAQNAQAQVRELVEEYPQYAQEILKKVSDYEERHAS